MVENITEYAIFMINHEGALSVGILVSSTSSVTPGGLKSYC